MSSCHSLSITDIPDITSIATSNDTPHISSIMMICGQEELAKEIQRLVEKKESILLIGPKGIGKSFIIREINPEGSDYEYINGAEMTAPNIYTQEGMGLEYIRRSLNMLIDDIDLLSTKHIDSGPAIDIILRCFIRPSTFCIATCTNISDLKPHVLSLFKHQIHITVTEGNQRRAIAKHMLKNNPSLPFQELLLELAEKKCGALPADFRRIITKFSWMKRIEADEATEETLMKLFDFSPEDLDRFPRRTYLNWPPYFGSDDEIGYGGSSFSDSGSDNAN